MVAYNGWVAISDDKLNKMLEYEEERKKSNMIVVSIK